MATGLELRLGTLGELGPGLGLWERLGVSGGVIPFPLALDSPITLASSLTDMAE